MHILILLNNDFLQNANLKFVASHSQQFGGSAIAKQNKTMEKILKIRSCLRRRPNFTISLDRKLFYRGMLCKLY